MPWRRRRREPDPAVAAEAQALATALAGGPLGGRPVVALAKRWPVAYADDKRRLEDVDLTNRFSHGEETPAAVLARTEGLSVADALAQLDPRSDWFEENWEDHVDEQLELTADAVGEAPSREEALALRPDPVALDRLLLDFEEARRRTTEPDEGRHLDWFEPHSSEKTAILFLPTPSGDAVPASLDFFGADGAAGHAALAVVLRHWRERYGAELVAAGGRCSSSPSPGRRRTSTPADAVDLPLH